MIRIAYVINYIVKNGPSSVVLNIINNLDREKYDVSLITLFSGNNPEVIEYLKSNGVSVYECATLSRMKCLLGQCKEFDDTVKKGHYDILHTHGLIPDIVSSRLNTPVRKITTIHNNMYEDYLDTYGYAKSRIFIALHMAALKKLDECVCCSKSKLFEPEMFTNGVTSTYEESEMLKQVFGAFEGFVCNKLYRKSLLQTKSIRLEQSIAVCEDLLFNVIYLLNCKKAVYNCGQKYFYRQIENSASNRLDNPKWFDAMKAYQQIIRLVKDYPVVYRLAAFQYAMFLCAAKYRIRFIEDSNGEIKRKVDEEWKRLRPEWESFNAKQRLKLYVFSIAPKTVIKYQRRML